MKFEESPSSCVYLPIDLMYDIYSFVFNLLFCISATTLGCIHVYICVCGDIYCCLIRTTCRSGAFKSRSRNGKKSACVTQGIIIKTDARLCGLFQFRHEAHTHTPITSTCRHTIDDRDHAKRKLCLDAR